jgi:hypothetical protein
VCGIVSDLPPPPVLSLPPTAHTAASSTAGAAGVSHSSVNTAHSTVAAGPATSPVPVPAATAGVCDVDVEREMDALKKTVSAINRLRPRFVVVTGSFTHAYPTSALPPSLPKPSLSFSTTPSSSSSEQPRNLTQHSDLGSDSLRDRQLNQFMRTMARVSETIPLLFVPGDRDVGKKQTQ